MDLGKKKNEGCKDVIFLFYLIFFSDVVLSFQQFLLLSVVFERLAGESRCCILAPVSHVLNFAPVIMTGTQFIRVHNKRLDGGIQGCAGDLTSKGPAVVGGNLLKQMFGTNYPL